MPDRSRDYPDKAYDPRRRAKAPTPEEVHGYLSQIGNSTTRMLNIHKVEEATARQDQYHSDQYR